VSVITTLYYVAITFHRQVWYRVLSLRNACIHSSGIILIPSATFVQNFLSFATSNAELAHGEKLCIQSLIHSASLFDASGTEVQASELTYLVSYYVHARLQVTVCSGYDLCYPA